MAQFIEVQLYGGKALLNLANIVEIQKKDGGCSIVMVGGLKHEVNIDYERLRLMLPTI